MNHRLSPQRMIICFSKARFTVLVLHIPSKDVMFQLVQSPYFSLSFWCFSPFSLGFSPPTSGRDLFGTWPMPGRPTVTYGDDGHVTWCCSPQAAAPSLRGAAPFPPRSAAPFPHRLEEIAPEVQMSFLGCFLGDFSRRIFKNIWERFMMI